jgi:hypothetical protein
MIAVLVFDAPVFRLISIWPISETSNRSTVENRYSARVCPRLELEWGGVGLLSEPRRGQSRAREFEPISVLISRKTQRLYVRKVFKPLFESAE